ncbi:MAG: DUF2207 domain-containing protein [Desulfovibrio sp.]|nr:DUF2207 domain-containing protein [Desulfovibrio sp.]
MHDVPGRLRLLAPILLLLCIVLAPAGAGATGWDKADEERILDYAVSAAIGEDAVMTVTERITVLIANYRIRHGIFRLFPVRIQKGGELRHYTFDVVSATLDGKPVPVHVSEQLHTKAAALGSGKRFAPAGRHTYEIVWKSTGHVFFLPERDEIYYNVTGNFWEFPIDHVSFTLALPKGGRVQAVKAYTGKLGDAGADWRKLGDAGVETTRALAKGEGLTVAMAWPKGVVADPGLDWRNWAGTHRACVLLGLPVLNLLVLLIFRLACGFRLLPPVVPLFSAQEGMTPGAAASLWRRRYPALLLQADVLWAAVNGYLHMDLRDRRTIVLTRTDPSRKWRSRPLPNWAAQRLEAITNLIFNGAPQAVVDMRQELRSETSVLTKAFLSLTKTYQKKFQSFWTEHSWPAWTAACLFLVAYYLGATSCAMPFVDAVEIQSPGGTILLMAGFASLIVIFAFCTRNMLLEGETLRACIPGVLCLASAVSFAVWIAQLDWLLMLSIALACAFLLFAFSGRAKVARLTPKGVQAYVRLKGLRRYIAYAEKDRLAAINAPEDSIEKYEEILPYAVALDCADAWQKRFAPLLDYLNYTPDWMLAEAEEAMPPSWRPYSAIHVLGPASELGTALTLSAAAYARAMHSPSGFFSSGSSKGSSGGSSSGFSGGSSGGGSGGGGGGGW